MGGRRFAAKALGALVAGALVAAGVPLSAQAAPTINWSVSATVSTVAEGDAGSTNVSFTITHSGPSGPTVDYTTVAGTATAGADYTAVSGSGAIKGATVQVPVLGDTTDENDETVSLTISNPSSGTIVTSTATVTITDDDAAPTISIDDVSLGEGDAGSTDAVFTASLSAGSGKTVTVDVVTVDVEASAGTDYTATSTSLSFTPGETSKPVTIPVLGDTLDEIDETFTVDLSNPVDVTLADGQGVGTVTDDDGAPSLSVDSPSVAENDAGGVLTFTISLDTASGKDVSVDYASADGTATDGSDYTAVGGTATILAGDTSATVDVAITDDGVYEGDEDLTLTLSNAVDAAIGTAAGTGTIAEDEAMPVVSVADASVAENDAGGVLTFTISLDTASGKDVSVDYASADGTATDGSDYTAVGGTATILAGDTSATVDVAITDDGVYEGDEDLTLTLSNAVDASDGTMSATGTVTDDETEPTLSIGDVSAAEGNTGASAATFTVTLSGASAVDVTADVASSDGSATAGSDYTAVSGSVTVPAGDTTASVSVDILGDTADEPDELFTLTLSNASGASIGDADASGTITDDDKAPTALTMKVRKGAKIVSGAGLLEQAATGSKVTVTLSKRSTTGMFVKVATKTVTVKNLGDRDIDGIQDAAYKAAFPKPKAGTYRLTARFTGSGALLPCSKSVRFRI